MSYSREVIDLALAELNARRKAAVDAQAAHRNEAVSKVPEIKKAEHQLAATASQLVKAIGMGEETEVFMKTLSQKNLAIQSRIHELLEQNGYPADYLDFHFTCPKCDDTGYISGVPCQCFQTLLKQIALNKLGSVSRSGECSFGNFNTDYYPAEVDEEYGVSPRRHMEQVYQYCRCYAEDFDRESENLYLYGETGLGKTHLTLAIAAQVTNAGYQVIYDSASNLLRRLEKERFSSGKDNEFSGAEDEILNCDLLIIDDLGSEFTTQFTVSAVYNIINTRLNCRKPVIISTNLDIRDLEQKYTKRVASRVLGNYRALLFMGRDIRQIKSKE